MADAADATAMRWDHRPREGYAPAQRRLHWIVAGLVALQLVVGCWIGLTPPSPRNHGEIEGLLTVHVITGTVIFYVMYTRWKLRRRVGAPPPPDGTPYDAALLARINHLGFYCLLLSLPVFGWLAFACDGRAAHFFGGIHAGLALTLVAAICAHLLGVAYHTYVRRDGLARRMIT